MGKSSTEKKVSSLQSQIAETSDPLTLSSLNSQLSAASGSGSL